MTEPRLAQTRFNFLTTSSCGHHALGSPTARSRTTVRTDGNESRTLPTVTPTTVRGDARHGGGAAAGSGTPLLSPVNCLPLAF